MKKRGLAAVLVLMTMIMTAGCGSAAKTETTALQTTTETTGAAAEAAPVSSDNTKDGATVVSTTYGPVKGVQEGELLTWYGIPYGKAPVGELRWQAPAAPSAWTEELNCTEASQPALQLSGTEVKGSEDCLKLDVYTKKGSKKLPVLVFIHGGNNQTGKAGEIPGADLVKNDNCVYVSVDYRLGLLGFNCLPALTAGENGTGNFAMLDIAYALDWVKENIEAFGGDPGNITISGFSAGGRDVMAMLISPQFKGKFQKAIAFSGGMTTASEDLSGKKIAKAIAPLAVEDKKAADENAAYQWLMTDSADVKDYLYSIPAERLVPLMGNAAIRMSVFPHLYEDGVVIPKNGFDTEDYNSVPLMMLTGGSEFSMFCLGDGYFKSDDMTGYSENEINAAKAFASKYGSDMYRIFNAQESAVKMYDHYQSDIYICQVNYGSDQSSVKDLGDYGAFHGIFVPMLSAKHNYLEFFPDAFGKAGYQAMAKQYNSYLANFLKSGDPNGDGLAAWSSWKPDKKVSMVLDGTQTDAVVEEKDVTTTYQDIMKAMDQDASVSDEIKAKMIKNVLNGRWFSRELDEHYGNKSLWSDVE
ncbi:carboxylesterase family protein [Lacrimispora defluvii]|uniref:Carboxylic ester hydrolase n=1 Tax=Lacrimispora defluvii TaxID=2719233 RepID=A0ABX1VSP5_9FIRM|nr:carboxylesterase family protein [Lacrimispora defluvii]NNJ30784.1 carboxylesterase/lipase family protein [Lacrimispora defluvii]